MGELKFGSHQDALDYVANLVRESNRWLNRGRVTRIDDQWYRLATGHEEFGDGRGVATFNISVHGDSKGVTSEMKSVPFDPDETWYFPITQSEALRLKVAQLKDRVSAITQA